MGAQGVQDFAYVLSALSYAPAQLLPGLRVKLDEVVQDAEPDLLQAGALHDLLGRVRVRDEELVDLGAALGLHLGPPDVQLQGLERRDLRARILFDDSNNLWNQVLSVLLSLDTPNMQEMSSSISAAV